MRARSATLAALTAFAVLVPAATAFSPRYHPEELSVTSHDRRVQATLGSGCFSRPEDPGDPYNERFVRVCQTAAYPLPTRGRLPVHARGWVRLELGAPGERVDVTIRRALGPPGSGREEVVRGPFAAQPTGRRRVWRVRLPRDFGRGRILGVSIRYKNGDDADFEARLSGHRHRGPSFAAGRG